MKTITNEVFFSTNIEDLAKATSIETNSKVLVDGEICYEEGLPQHAKNLWLKSQS
jgi:hypothetical protein